MAEKIIYYAMLIGDRALDNPSGVTRRRILEDGGVRDEALSRDLTWIHNPGLAGWERGDLTNTYVEISKEEADRIVEQFRARWGAQE